MLILDLTEWDIGFQGNLCDCLLNDSILGYSIRTPRYLACSTSWI